MGKENWQRIYDDTDLIILDNFHKLPSAVQRIKGMVCVLIINRGTLNAEINEDHISLKSSDVLIMSTRVNISNVKLSEDLDGMIIAIREISSKALVKVNTHMLKCLFRLSDHPILHMAAEQRELFGHYHSILCSTLQNEDKTYQKEIVYRIVGAMLYELFTCIFTVNNIQENDESSSVQGERLFKQFMELLVSSEVKERQVQYYAHKLYISPKHLSVVCKQQTGKTARVWINEFILTDIKYMLENSDWSIKEISNYLGFPNASFFGKYVRQYLGKSPSRIRAASKKKSK